MGVSWSNMSMSVRDVKFSLAKLVLAGNDGEVWMPDWSGSIAFPSKAGIFRGRPGGTSLDLSYTKKKTH